MAKEIEFRIGPDGKIDMELIGFHGDGCAEEARKHVEKLGESVHSEQKAEFYDTCDTDEDQEQYGS
jgi:hypothetical protein